VSAVLCGLGALVADWVAVEVASTLGIYPPGPARSWLFWLAAGWAGLYAIVGWWAGGERGLAGAVADGPGAGWSLLRGGRRLSGGAGALPVNLALMWVATRVITTWIGNAKSGDAAAAGRLLSGVLTVATMALFARGVLARAGRVKLPPATTDT
ncbi:MAG: hypothetical protein ACRD0F_02505, partial [Acidimicrobiales bacterium]